MTPKELVVFLPAVGGDPSFWAPQVEALGGAYATLALDLVRPADAVSMAGFADDVAAAIAARGYALAHVVGLSLGGVVALELWRRHPGRVRSLTLASSWAWQPEGEARLAWFEGELARLGLPGFSRMSLPGLFAPATGRDLVEHGVGVESAKDADMYRACWREMLRADLREAVRGLDVPLLLIGGALDQATPTALLAAIAERVPTARLVELAGAAHFSNLDRPDDFTRHLRAHVRAAGGGDDRLGIGEDDLTFAEEPCAERLLRLMAARGVELLAANSGTDFTPIIDALAHLAGDPGFRLRVVQAPHENTTVALAHGHALLSRRAQAVMAHVNVGTANIGLGLTNARRARVPMLALAGRTPLYEEGSAGVRTNFVQWGQEVFDQAAMFRELTKWDYELRAPRALPTALDRALAIAESDPKGPVYLTLPKEPLCELAPAGRVGARQLPARPALPDGAALEAAAVALARAARPLIVTADLGRHAGGPEALVRFAEAAGAGVIEHGKRNFFNFPTEHPHHLGFEPLPFVAEADLVIAVECPVPWIPAFAKLARPPRVVSIGVDPLFADLPLRGFPSDLTLAGDPVATLRALTARVVRRPVELAARHDEIFATARRAAAEDAALPEITKRYLSYTLGRVLDDDAILFNEYNVDPLLVPRRAPDSWFENSCASGLGWSLGAALGGKLAAPERTVVVALGDGSYLFNAPLSAHYVATAESLPILIVVFNDTAWSTIKKSTKGSHPDGWAARTGRFALCDFAAAIAYEQVAEAAGGIGLRVAAPTALEPTLRDALARVRTGDRHVLVNVVCRRDG
jgi:acetolactate synthase-1/2/3 large subunit